MTDKSYDARSNQSAARDSGIVPLILVKKNTRQMSERFPKTLYKGGSRIEQLIGNLKRFKRIALRYETTAEDFASLVSFACSPILVKSVRRT